MRKFEMEKFVSHITKPEIKKAYENIVEYFKDNRYWQCYFVSDIEIHLIFTGACLTPEFMSKTRKDLGLEKLWVTYAPSWDYNGLIVCGTFKNEE